MSRIINAFAETQNMCARYLSLASIATPFTSLGAGVAVETSCSSLGSCRCSSVEQAAAFQYGVIIRKKRVARTSTMLRGMDVFYLFIFLPVMLQIPPSFWGARALGLLRVIIIVKPIT